MSDLTIAYEGRRELGPSARLLVGGIGGVTPIVVSIVGGEYRNFEVPQDFYFYVGFLVRVVAFFALGAVMVWLHHGVRDRYPVFRLGITAPAVFAALLNANHIPADEAQTDAGLATTEIRVAQLASSDRPVLSDAWPGLRIVRQQAGGSDAVECIVKGFLGKKCK